jgi:chromate transport protein ChrA
MSNSEKSDAASSCENCPGCGHSHEMPGEITPGGLSGWPLATAAFFVFVLPVGLAIVGAAVIGKDPNGQLLGALAGFAVGVVLAAVVARMLRRKQKNKTDSTDFTD